MNTLTEQTRLWQLISPALPAGGFHYSQGLETAVQQGWVHDTSSTSDWIFGLLGHTLAAVDLPILVRILEAWRCRDSALVRWWDQQCHAYRETRELREEEQNRGRALLRLITDLGDPVPDAPFGLGFVAAFAVAAAPYALSSREVAAGYAWSWCEGQVGVAIKLVPLGQTDGQRILRQLGSALPETVDAALLCLDEDIGRSTPCLAISSANHETQYSKLFRS